MGPKGRSTYDQIAKSVKAVASAAELYLSASAEGTAIVSPEELFDVVDESDCVVEVRTRSEVHRLKLLHRAVHIFVFRSDQSMLIHLRTDTKEEFPSVWTSSASGHVSSGESYSTSADRELQEELGIRASLKRVLRVDACADTSNEFTELFVAHSDDRISVDPEEIADVDWVTPGEIERRLSQRPDDFSPAFRLLFKKFRTECQLADG